ncbi:MAG: radical SAM protein, partial [Saprospiraceae bacterium]|nr:radical SAM protein [Saprospiraceae bacterium]
MKILLCNAYFYQLDRKQWKTKQPYPPLGTLYAASVIKQLGHELIFIDNSLEEGIEKTKKSLAFHRPDVFIIYEDGFNYLTKMCLTSMRDAAHAMLAFAKDMDADTICCSSDASDHFDHYLDAGADFVITGEGEKTLEDLLLILETGVSVDDLPGIVYKDSTGHHKNVNRPVIRDLDTLADPAWELVNFESYRHIWLKHHRYFSLNIASTRGCPFKCNWCAKPIYGNRYNSRSPERVVKEMEMLMEVAGVNHFWVCDDIFGLKPGWVQAFSNLVN